jgi:nucleolar MIF4G domain-containing protein 1
LRQDKKAKRGQPYRNTRREDNDGDDKLSEDRDEDEIDPGPPLKRLRISPPANSRKDRAGKSASESNHLQSESENEEEYSRPLVSSTAKAALENDDAEIAFLEKKLGLRGKKSGKGLIGDGLDELLDGVDAAVNLSSEDSADEEDQRWLGKKRKKFDAPSSSNRGKSTVTSTELEQTAFSESDSEDEGDEVSSNDELTGDSESDGSDLDEDEFGGFKDDLPPPKKVRENPYKPPVDASTGSKYVPPSLRPLLGDEEEATRIRRQLQGPLNRLSESNILAIAKDVELAMSRNPRQPAMSSLIDLLMGSIADRTSLLDTFIVLHAGFIAAMYKTIGSHFGAQILERLITDFTRHHNQQKEKYDGSKECANIVALLAEIYTFQVISSTMVFDIIKLLLTELTDLNTELLLRLIKSMCPSMMFPLLTLLDCGPQLRQDDPAALKDVVFLLQQAVAAGEADLPVRTKFMIETISNLKNNRLKASTVASAITSEHVLRLKKTLGSLKTRSHATTEPLNVSLKDIQRADKTGKWWLVGASWKDEKNENDASHKEDASFIVDGETDVSADLLSLAKQHRMNTNVRRAIFVAIMSSADYKDAWVKLRRLSLNKSQRCEIPRVLVHCAGAEGAYNPYYRVLAGKLCGERAHLVSFRFNLWDIFRRMGDGNEEAVQDHEREKSIELRELVNLAKMFGELIGTDALPITVLKVLSILCHIRNRCADLC